MGEKSPDTADGAKTQPPIDNYAELIAASADCTDDCGDNITDTKALNLNGSSAEGGEIKQTEIPAKPELHKLLTEAFGEKYAAAIGNGSDLSQPPPPNLQNEIAVLEALDGPIIEIGEATLAEQLLINEELLSAARALSFFADAGIDISEQLGLLESYLKSYKEHVTGTQISFALMHFFKDLATSLLLALKKKRKHTCPATEAMAKEIVLKQNLSTRESGKAMVPALRMVTKACELHELINPSADDGIYRDFLAALLSKEKSD